MSKSNEFRMSSIIEFSNIAYLFCLGIIIILYAKPNLFYGFLFIILHLMFKIYRMYLYIFTNVQTHPTLINQSQILEDLKGLNKIPKHLAIMFWGDVKEKTLIEAAQLCCWTWCFGIKVLSIYEAEGNLKQNANSLQSHINNISQQFFIHEKIVPKIRVTALDTSINYENNDLNKSDLDLDLQVNLVSREDGRKHIIKTTKNLANDVIQGKFKSDDLDTAELDRRLSVPKLSEPQLIIFFSPNIDIDGFPPWHIHLTELFHIPENYKFGYSIFLQGLRKYSKCDQRFGR
ncbi:hypothetical protein Glove_34g85 [Diversispora epigaea]|uniref:ditrans,polycis-polyprenyl diphosphate synthase [(2E,6E)-farnesyldiphosphate specific] n=1 Tax=Diversispora epigaea TaxID=1348612 RepID=A0A397JHF4_9GLOM|nr:hypothetical protein Glove_34g85 [Diversispora epigaea]